MSWRRASVITLGAALPCLGLLVWEARAEPSRVSGSVLTTSAEAITLRQDDGTVALLTFAPDCRVVLGQAIGRWEVQPGEMVGLSAYVVQVTPAVSGLVAYSFVTADAAVPASARMELVERFLPPSVDAPMSDKELRTRRIAGPFVALRNSMVMIIHDRSGEVTVKIGPEAYGYRLSQDVPRGVPVGSRIVARVALGRVDGILLMKDTPAR